MTITLKPLDMGDIEPVNAGKEPEPTPVMPKEFSAAEIDQTAHRSFAAKCERFHLDPGPFAAFLANVCGDLRLVSFACSPTDKTDRKKLLSSASRTAITHIHPLVLARRGFIRYLIREAKQLEITGTADLLERNEEGELQLKKDCQIYMYSTSAHVCENVYWGIEAIKGHDINHCIMNKIRRWSMLGLQGALLSNIFAPVYFSKFVIGSAPPVPVNDVWNLLFKDLDWKGRQAPAVECVPVSRAVSNGDHGVSEAPGGDGATELGSARISPTTSLDRTIVWYQGLIGLDHIDRTGKLDQDGTGSSVCKMEIFKAYLQLGAANKSILKYSRAKKKAGHYQALKKVLYKKWENENNGKWLKRKSNKVDKFWVQLRST
ncbi:unnamed protein product [Caenorhabditis brenneri]